MVIENLPNLFISYCQKKYEFEDTFEQCMIKEGYVSTKFHTEHNGYWTMDDKEAMLFLLKWS